MFRRGSLIMTIWNLLVAAGLIALGVATCVNNANPDFRNVMFMIAGIFVIVDASLRLLTQVIQIVRFDHGVVMKTSLGSAATGASELAIGILLILISQEAADMDAVWKYLIYFISILLITLGAVAIIYAIVFLVRKIATVVRNVAAIVFGALLVTAGVLILVYVTNEHLIEFIFVMVGIIFMLTGIGLAMLAVLFAIAAHRGGKLVEEAAKEAEPAAEEPVKEEPAAEEPTAEEPKDEAEEKPEDKAE